MKKKPASRQQQQQHDSIGSQEIQQGGASFQHDSMDLPISDSEIAARAYEEFENSGCEHGHDVEHWLTAESRIAAERSF